MINSQSCVSNLRLLAFSLQKFDMSNFSECRGAVADVFSLLPTLGWCVREIRFDLSKFDMSNIWICTGLIAGSSFSAKGMSYR